MQANLASPISPSAEKAVITVITVAPNVHRALTRSCT